MKRELLNGVVLRLALAPDHSAQKLLNLLQKQDKVGHHRCRRAAATAADARRCRR